MNIAYSFMQVFGFACSGRTNRLLQ